MSMDNHEQYIIKNKIGEGGMGTVYLAEDVLLQRQVAIKALNKPQGLSAEQLEERFQQEALALARLNHSNITHLYAFVPRRQTYWMVMEYVEGKTLEEWLHIHGTIDALTSCSVIAQILDGLEHAHRKGIIHRDLKPANIMVSSEGEVKIMDFGIARIRNSQRLTQHGKSVGTLEYMAPEQIQGKEGDELTDLYATANMLYEMLAGTPPFKSDTDYLLMKAKLNDRPPLTPTLAAHTGKDLQNVIFKGLEKTPSRRYGDVRSFKEALLKAVPHHSLLTGHSLQEALQNKRQDTDLPRVRKTPLQLLSSLPVKKSTVIRKKDELFSFFSSADRSVKILLGVAVLCAGLITWNALRTKTNNMTAVAESSNDHKVISADETESPTASPGIIEAQLIQNNMPAYTPVAFAADAGDEKDNHTPTEKPEKKDIKKPVQAREKDVAPEKKTDTAKEKEPEPRSPASKQPVEPGNAPSPETSPKKNPVQIPRGTSVSFQLQESVSSEEKSKDGKLIRLTCAADVVIDGEVIVHKGAEAIGKIVDVEPSAKRKKGLVGFVILKVQGRDGKDIRVESQRFRLRSDADNEAAVYPAGKSFSALLRKGTVVK